MANTHAEKTFLKEGRNDSVRTIEEKARRRKQEEIRKLRETLGRIQLIDYKFFLSAIGEVPKYSCGQLVEWQVIRIANQTIM
jgi:hypothetical protein